MNHFNSIRELLNTLNRGSNLITEMFEKRKSFPFRYEHAIELLDNNDDIIKLLINKNIIVSNGIYLELNDRFLHFFEDILEVNEEINTAYIHDNIKQVKENIIYYLQSNTNNERLTYLRNIKLVLRKIGRNTLRNIIDLNRNIDNAFKTEPNYKIKLSKLEHYEQKLESIQILIEQTEYLLSGEERTFFNSANDEELKEIRNQLILDLTESRHNLIEIRQQIIEYINQIKYQSKFIEKLKQLKYLRDQFEIKHKTNIKTVLLENNAIVFEKKPQLRLKLSIDNLQKDDNYTLIRKVRQRYKSTINPLKQIAENLTLQDQKLETEEEIYIDLYKIRNHFKRSGKHLFDFLMGYQFVREISFEERVTMFCQIVSIFEDELELCDEFMIHNNIEYAVVYPKYTEAGMDGRFRP
jgi:hypothetical protein